MEIDLIEIGRAFGALMSNRVNKAEQNFAESGSTPYYILVTLEKMLIAILRSCTDGDRKKEPVVWNQ
jgi:hypothetical protein